MHTPTTGKIAALLAVQKPEIAPNESGGAGDAFGRMLNQQIADRRAADNAARTAAAARPAKPAEQAKATDPAKPAETPKPAAAAESPPAGTQTDETGAAAESGEERADATVAEEAAAIPPSIASMLALAANRLAPETGAATDAKTGTQAGIAAARTAPDGAAHLAMKADADDLRGSAGDAAAGRFAAALDEAGERARTAENAGAGRMLASAGVADHKADPAMLTAAAAPASQVGFDATLAATGRTADRLAPQVGTPGWNQALGQKVIWMVAGAQQSASLSLNPPDLGPLQVVLNVNNGQADASFFAAQPEVRQALEAALPRLRDMMQDAGVALGQATVSAGMPGQQHAGGASGQGSRQGTSGPAPESENADSTLPPARNGLPGSSGQGLVDTFA